MILYRQRALGMWVTNQRVLKNKGRLPADRVARLEGVGFIWASHNVAWEDAFAQLQRYKEQHGDTNVPRASGALGTWASNQRASKKKGTLSAERVVRLDAIGFVWSFR